MKEKPLLCDFCSIPNPIHRIPTRTFEMKTKVIDKEMTNISDGDFMACGPCYALVEAGDREGLLKRVKTSYIRTYGTWDRLAEKILRRFHEQFWKHKIDEKKEGEK